jgi:uncharacterized protein YggU (UPF0235/DUF167 family)
MPLSTPCIAALAPCNTALAPRRRHKTLCALGHRTLNSEGYLEVAGSGSNGAAYGSSKSRPPVRLEGLRVIIRVAVTPGARRDSFEGHFASAIGKNASSRRLDVAASLRVRARPANNRANDAVIELAAKQLGLAKSRISLQSGSRSRVKTLCIEGDVTVTLAGLARLGALPPEFA